MTAATADFHSQTDDPNAPPGVRARGLRVETKEGLRLVGPVSFDLTAGRWTAVLGRSGSGKSSILRAIAAIAPRIAGELSASDGAPVAGRAAWMAQDALLAPWLSCRQNVAFGDRMRNAAPDLARAERALDTVGLGAFADRAPDQLSGGERQRVALARTLYEDRPIALLDEPFSALDALTRDEVSALAAERLAGRTVAHVTHDPMEAARLADRILLLAPSGARVAEAPLDAAAQLPTPRPTDAPACFELAGALRRALAALEDAA